MARARLFLIVAIPIAFTAVVYYPITRNYFLADDFLNLYSIVNFDPAEYLLTPHGGHLLMARNAAFWACFQVFGSEPAGYFWLVLLTHLLNTFLLFVVVRRSTGSPRLACFGATLWGISPVQEGSLGWYAVYGHVLATTTMLLILVGATRLHAENRPPSADTLTLWYALALIGGASFGVGIGVAMVLPFALALVLVPAAERPRWRLPLLSLLLVVPLLYAGANRLYGALSPGVPGTAWIAEAHILHWETVLPMLIQLFLDGIAELSLGFLHEPHWLGGWTTLVIVGLWTFGAIRLLRRGSRGDRAQLLAFLGLAVGCYGTVAAGRASFYETAGVALRTAAATPRYHYAALLPLTLILCLLLRQIQLPGPSGARAALVALIAWLALAFSSFAITPGWIDHHETTRAETGKALAAILARIQNTREGGRVYIPNTRFEEVGPLVPKTMFPGRAALFTIFFPTDTVDGKRIYFSERNPSVIEAARRGRRISKILISPSRPRRARGKRNAGNWFERKMEELNR